MTASDRDSARDPKVGQELADASAFSSHISGGASSLPRSSTRSYAASIVASRRSTLGVFGSIGVLSCYQAPALFENVQDQIAWDVLDGTPTKKASDEFALSFPNLLDAKTESLLVWSETCPSLVDGDCGVAVKQILDVATKTLRQLDAASDRGWVSVVRSYYNFPIFFQKSPFLSEDKRKLLFQWTWKFPLSRSVDAAATATEVFRKAIEVAGQVGLDIHAAGGGPVATHTDVTEASVQDSGVHALAFLPVGLAVVGWRIGSLLLPLVPLITAAGSLATSFALASFLCLVVPVNSMAPALMSFFTISLSVDYSLFLLTRYADERNAGATWRPALEAMVEKSGGVVLVSGSVIAAGSVAGVVLPGGFIGVALATTISCITCIVWNVLVVPAIIGSAPGFFDCCSTWGKGGSPQLANTCSLTSSFNAPVGRGQSCEASQELIERFLSDSPWFWWATQITRWPVNVAVVVAVLVFCMPLTVALTMYEPSIDTTSSEPRGAPSTFVNQQIRNEFASGAGCPSPLFVLMRPQTSPGCSPTVRSDTFFDSSCHLAERILSSTEGTPFELDARSIMGVSFSPKSLTEHSTKLSCLPWKIPFTSPLPDASKLLSGNGLLTGALDQLRSLYLKVWQIAVSPDETYSVLVIAPSQDATTPEGFKLVQLLRSVVATAGDVAVDGKTVEGCGLDAWLLSEPSAVYDFVAVTLRRLPGAIGCSMLLAFLFVGCKFWAVFLPVKLFITVALPICWTYGLAVLIYQFGVLEWMQIDSVRSDHGFLWTIPVCTCTMLLGLGLDYDLFLFSRIWELRTDGYGNLDAIRLGVASTAGTITSAGLVFVMEFSGALLSAVPANNQIGAVIAIAVLIDITIVELCFVPAMLSLGVDLNWWPVKMPEPDRSVSKVPSIWDCQSSSLPNIAEGSCGLLQRQQETVPMLYENTTGDEEDVGLPVELAAASGREGPQMKVW
eukprot:TRINITY_DN2950_c0_g2_i4.p1 TRINITY_DN2950_c0_g2~~TRINITY_DN2950_c0_g2_i4.p1  ORF type:complete len:956 (+),score=128.36 TRINITY_DN2950_c0_g2_i4:531-3398(+)